MYPKKTADEIAAEKQAVLADLQEKAYVIDSNAGTGGRNSARLHENNMGEELGRDEGALAFRNRNEIFSTETKADWEK